MLTRKLRVYADTSVYGGCFDDEFADESEAFFSEVRTGRFVLVVSTVTLRELSGAPERVQGVLAGVPSENVESFPDSREILDLRDAYIEAGVVGLGSKDDAEHVAAASVADVDVVVSWNFRHIVHLERINGYHAVNLLRGYRTVNIRSPREVIEA